ncbi:hypothetical protein GUJ93_ZPchr0013g34251 [Zizania palustris]|uniref:Uncharacterized protein n=1 Tax=Zizania palustris TaxID=103762 RepID=A0A8J5X1I9_ZIZPA|nr:hypothetical protein GUJ93_ZPchr0013g34251 [Zizania palustris]
MYMPGPAGFVIVDAACGAYPNHYFHGHPERPPHQDGLTPPSNLISLSPEAAASVANMYMPGRAGFVIVDAAFEANPNLFFHDQPEQPPLSAVELRLIAAVLVGGVAGAGLFLWPEASAAATKPTIASMVAPGAAGFSLWSAAAAKGATMVAPGAAGYVISRAAFESNP